jgi:hypothetical protein
MMSSQVSNYRIHLELTSDEQEALSQVKANYVHL